MKPLNCLLAAACTLTLAAGPVAGQNVYSGMSFGGLGAGEGDTHTALYVRPDGSCALTNEVVQSRKMFELQVTSWERYAKLTDGAEPGDDIAAAAALPDKSEPKPRTSEELTAKIREMYAQLADSGEAEAVNVEVVEVSTNSVRLVTSSSFPSLKELLSRNLYTWGPAMLPFEDARFEIDTNRSLRITFDPAKSAAQAAARYTRDLSREWKVTKIKSEWKLVLPGKILASGLPQTQQNATWLSLDSEKPETLDAAIKLIGTPLVITAEPAGLKLDEPLESKKLARAARTPGDASPDVPVTDAAPGFLAEPVSLTLTTVHYFPEGEKYFQDRPETAMYGLGSTGVLVTAKIFPPKGRTIKTVTDARVKLAKDDQGRPIATAADDDEGGAENYRQFMSSSSDDETKGGAVRVELHLALPAADAKSIDELQAEAVALTIGSWKEMTLTNVQADANKEIDLGEVLPGAKMIIQKLSGTTSRSIQASLEGPAAVSQLEVKVKTSGRMGGQSNLSERRSKKTGDKTTRNITIQSYEFNMDGEAAGGPLTLLVRLPQNVKRERVKFKLTGLDLL